MSRQRGGLVTASADGLSASAALRSIGLLGGSFDPVHHGHLIVGQVAAETLGLDELRFVPAREQPFKIGRHAAPAEHRAAMLDLAVGAMPGFAVERGGAGPGRPVLHGRDPPDAAGAGGRRGLDAPARSRRRG